MKVLYLVHIIALVFLIFTIAMPFITGISIYDFIGVNEDFFVLFVMIPMY